MNFWQNSRYTPADTTRYLRNWDSGIYKTRTGKVSPLFMLAMKICRLFKMGSEETSYTGWIGSWQPREMISVSGPGGKNFMVHTVIIPWQTQHLSTHSQKGRALAEHLIWWAMYGRWWMICISMEQTILRLSGEEVITNLNQAGGIFQGGPQSLDKTQIFLIGFTRLWQKLYSRLQVREGCRQQEF